MNNDENKDLLIFEDMPETFLGALSYVSRTLYQVYQSDVSTSKKADDSINQFFADVDLITVRLKMAICSSSSCSPVVKDAQSLFELSSLDGDDVVDIIMRSVVGSWVGLDVSANIHIRLIYLKQLKWKQNIDPYTNECLAAGEKYFIKSWYWDKLNYLYGQYRRIKSDIKLQLLRRL